MREQKTESEYFVGETPTTRRDKQKSIVVLRVSLLAFVVVVGKRSYCVALVIEKLV